MVHITLGMGKFPSPGGDYGLSDASSSWSRTTARSSFRPLAGITVFRTTLYGAATIPDEEEFPSPGGDYGLSDFRDNADLKPRVTGFRPLAGITVFRTWVPIRISFARRRKFPSPGGDYGLSDLMGKRSASTSSLWVSVPWRGLRSFGLERSSWTPGGST